VIKAIESGMFGEDKDLKELMKTLEGKKDRFLVKYELKAYIEAQEKVINRKRNVFIIYK